jgi:serine/threonine protein kinase/Tol biopolymer transport system component
MSADWDALQALFEGALARPKDERGAYLDQHTNGDAALRREVESLLAAHEGAGAFLSTPAVGPAAAGSARLAAGTSLGVFTILEPLGAGGMGEVFRACDTRLDRQVAIKVLSSERNTAPGARERFEREARAISRLSHPRICTVHDVGVAVLEGADVPYLVMELLDGETLAARIVRGPLSIEQSLGYAIDIADALIAAHAQGIVHRDLKPANVMLTGSGVKLLDFGLAQLREPTPAGVSAAALSSVSGLTSEGLVLGTLPYTSPEQLRGEKVDTRTDIFAFGAVLYEMLTGERPFVADSQAGLIAAILEHDAPPVSDAEPLAAARLDRIVHRCLAKNPDDRWQTARDLKSELVWVRDGRDDGTRAPRPIPPGKRPGRWRQSIAVGLPTIAALTLAVALWRAPSATTPQRAVTRASLNLPPGVTFYVPINGTSLAIAPDGSRIAFIGARQGATSLFIHTLSARSPVEVPDTRDAMNPMFSPEGEWVAFFQARALKKVPAAGGPVQTSEPADRAGVGPATWLADGRIVRGNQIGSPVRQFGAEQRDLTRVMPGEDGHLTPLSMRDGSLLFAAMRGGFQGSLNRIMVVQPGAPAAREVVADATSPQLAGNGAIVFARGRSLFAAGFDSRAIRLTGEPRAMDVQVQTVFNGAPMYALANNGTLVYAESSSGRRLVWVDRSGNEEFAKTGERMYAHMRLSPDGTRVAAAVSDADRALWVFGLDGSLVQKLTSGPARNAMPLWSPDGKHIFFTKGDRAIFRASADGSTDEENLFEVESPRRLDPLSITPDGKRLLVKWEQLPQFDLGILELGPPRAFTKITQSGTARDGSLSPDGRWVAYQSTASTGGYEGQIIVRPFPDVQRGQWVVSTGVGRQPIWSPTGRELFYRTEDGAVMAVPIATTPAFKHDPPVRVVTPVNTLRDWASGPTYAVSPDGRRFLFIRAPELDIRSLTVVLNWDVEVKAAIGLKEK